MTSPKPPPFPDRRAHRRIGLLAQVQLRRADEVHIMRTLNLSKGGVFLCGKLEQMAAVLPGALAELLIFAPDNIDEDVRVSARVVRVQSRALADQPVGLAMAFTRIDGPNADKLDRLLSR